MRVEISINIKDNLNFKYLSDMELDELEKNETNIIQSERIAEYITLNFYIKEP